LYDPHNENVAPYRFGGDNNPANLPVGEYTMTTRAYTQDNRNGSMCDETVTPFSIVNCATAPIAGTTLDACETRSTTIPTDGTWTDILDENGHLIASFSDPNAVNLGTMTLDIKRPSSTRAMAFPNMGNLKMINRHFHLVSSNYADGVTLPNPVQVRLYFTQNDVLALNSSTIGDYGLSNYTANELYLTHYYGDNQDCDYINNTLTPANSMNMTKTHQSYACDGHYFEFELTHFSEFFIHEPATPLPVELLSFRGWLIDDRSRLDWESASEYNAKGYEVQRSFDAQNWEVLGFVEAEGQPANYVFWDNAPRKGTNYYRLRVVDLDGSSELTEVIRVFRLENHEIMLGEVTPNPVKDPAVTLPVITTVSKEARVSIYSSVGQILYHENVSFDAGETMLSLPAQTLASGIYWVRLVVNGQAYTRKFEVVR
jgi:hypothetical protein